MQFTYWKCGNDSCNNIFKVRDWIRKHLNKLHENPICPKCSCAVTVKTTAEAFEYQEEKKLVREKKLNFGIASSELYHDPRYDFLKKPYGSLDFVNGKDEDEVND